jgi:cytidylate kinase
MEGMYETPGIAQMVEREWKKWLLLIQGRADEKRRAPISFPTITVSRERGSGGGIIAGKVAEKLGFVLFDSEIVDYVARSASLDRLVVEHMDEHSQRSIRDWTQRVLHQQGFSPQTYMAHLTKAILTIGEKGRAVIVGRGAHLILPSARCLRVRMIAPMEIRIERVCAAAGLTYAAGQTLVADTDRERTRYIQENFRRVDGDPLLYDLTVNTGELSLEAATGLVVQAVLARFPQLQESQVLAPSR